jgi:hypothetical protein
MQRLIALVTITLFASLTYLVVPSTNIYSQSEEKVSVLLPVRVDGSWGYINEKGTIVIKPRFKMAGSCSEGLADVMDDDGWFYYIDATGTAVTKGK